MPDPIYPPRRPNLAHFEPPKKPVVQEKPQPKLTPASVDKLTNDAKLNRRDRPKP